MAKILTALILVCGAAAAFWTWQGRALDFPAVPDGRFQCLSYAPSHAGGTPLDGADYKVPDGMIASDLAALSKVTECVRTYSSYGVQGDVLPIAARLDMKVMLGIWIGAKDEVNRREIDAALAVARRHPEAVRAIVVGNEVLLRREMTGERLAGIIRSVKAQTDLPVTYADIYEFWRRNPVVAEAVDFVTLHVLPYWDDPVPRSVGEMEAHVAHIINRAQETFPRKELRIGEIGWPSAGRTRGGAVPGRVNQARFVREFAAGAEALGVPYNLIEAIDQPWKRAPEGTVGGYWGILDSDRDPKFPLTGPVREWPLWYLAAAFAMGMALLAVGWIRAIRGGAPGFARWLAVATSGALTGSCLWMLWPQVWALAIGLPGTVWAIYLLAICLLGGAVMTAACGGLPALSSGTGRGEATGPLGAFHWAVLIPAAILALSIALDGRHRDFLTLAFLPPALAFAVASLHNKWAGIASRGAMAAWTAVLLIVFGPLGIDIFGNVEALAWAACCLLLAVPLVRALPGEGRSLRRAFAAPHQP